MDDLTPEARRMCDLIKDIMFSTPISEEPTPRWDQVDVYLPLAELQRALMIDAEWAAMSEWDKDLWEMKHLPEKERMNSIEGIVEWLPDVQRDQRQMELLEEVLRFGEPAATLESSTELASSTPDISTVLKLDVVHGAVDNLAAPTPSTCSTICPGGNKSVTLTPTPPAAVPASPKSPGAPPRYITSQDDNMCKDMPQALLLNGFFIECTQLMLWAVKIPWPPDFYNRSTCIQNIPQLDCQGMSVLPRTSSLPLRVESVERITSRIGMQLSCLCSQDAELFVSYFAAWRISNLHGTMDSNAECTIAASVV